MDVSKQTRVLPRIESQEIDSVVLLRRRPLLTHFYVFPFIVAYPLAAYAYFVECV